MARQSVAFRILALVKPYRRLVALAFLCAAIFAASSGASLGMILPVFDDVFARAGDPVSGRGLIDLMEEKTARPGSDLLEALSRFSPGGVIRAGGDMVAAAKEAMAEAPPGEVLLGVVGVIVFLILLKNLAGMAQEFLLARVEQGVLYDLRKALYSHLLHLDLDFFARSRSGELLSRLTADVDRLKGAITEALVNVAKQVILLAVFLGIALWASWKLTLVTLLVLPPSMMIILIIGRKLRKKSHRSQEKMADFASMLQESTLGIRVVKAFSMEEFEERRFQKVLASHARYETSLQRLKALAGPLTEVLGAAASGVIFWYGGRAVLGGEGMSAGQFFVFLGAALSMMDPVKDLSKAHARIMAGLASGDRVFKLLDEKPAIVEEPDAVALRTFEHSIRFSGVSFGYDREPVLRSIDLELARGEVLALVGPSGAGKSTLADMIPRFIDPVEGRITIDGIDLRRVRLADLRRLMGVVTQETVLFNDTIRNNIAYGDASVPLERVKEAARVANILDFVTDLPEGFDTVIGERGVTLSGGQRQRLAIARAVLKDPPILILDEATSSLDTESERLVQQAIDTLIRGRTSLVIAHRLSTIRHAQRIIFMEEGRIVEQGRHDELMALGGRYRRLYDLQFHDGQTG
ncbi:ABC transporter ATP-binding protein [Candidatus Fermentibacteria bacterium]|nr:ABC transporter ATP-binding protein [Candidatus Fermentibacteria bacterium]